MSRRNSSQINRDGPLFDEIPEYNEIITELARGNLKADFSLEMRKSRLSYSLNEILFDEKNDELSYFILFMDSLDASNYVKFLLDLKNFKSAVKLSSQISCKSCPINNDQEKYRNNDCECVVNINKMVGNDALSIFSKYITQDAKYSIEASSDIIEETIENICPENDTQIDLNCFNASRIYVQDKLQTEFYDKYLTSEYHCKYISNILENYCMDLPDLLYDDLAVVYFLEYLEQSNKSDLLKFWMQAENFSRNILNFNEKFKNKKDNQSFTVEDLYNQWQSDAIIIYDNFISLQAKNKLGFDQFARQSVESNICFQNVENEELDSFISSYANCFYVPMLIVYSILEKVYFKKFISSVLFQKFVKEIKFSSIILSVHKIKSEITDKITKDKSKKPSQFNQLWARPTSGNLQFGKVDSSGRYIGHDGSVNVRSDLSTRIFNDITNEYDDDWNLDNIEEDQSKKTGASLLEKKLKLKFNQLINKIPMNGMTSNNSKTYEDDLELAEQMADMLVRDVVRDNNI